MKKKTKEIEFGVIEKLKANQLDECTLCIYFELDARVEPCRSCGIRLKKGEYYIF